MSKFIRNEIKRPINDENEYMPVTKKLNSLTIDARFF